MPEETGPAKNPDENYSQSKANRKHAYKVAIFPALITGGCAIAAAFIGLSSKVDAAGDKINVANGASTSTYNNLKVGFQTYINLCDPKVALSSVLPPKPCPQPVQPTPSDNSKHTEMPIPDEDAITVDPKILSLCYGLGQLKLQKVQVDLVDNGYSISMKLQNDGPAETLAVQNEKLTDARFTVGGQSNIGPGPYAAERSTDQANLAQAYNTGVNISKDDATSLDLHFNTPGVADGAKKVTFGATLLHFTKGEDGIFARKTTTMGCVGIPVMGKR